MNVLVPAVAGAMAAILLWAGLEKARRPSAFGSLLAQLGVPHRAAPAVALLVIAVELGVGAGLALGPSIIALVGVVVLAAGFACAGLLALLGDKRLRCGCFGPYGGQLGRSQLLAFPLWLGGVAFLWASGATHGADAAGASLLAAVALTIAGVRLAGAVLAADSARDDRRSAREMLLWLSR